MSGFVGAQHEFHDAAFVQGWADRFGPTPPRIALFDLILERVSAPGLPNAHVLELGLGPGYMARHILERNRGLSYEELDFSEEFFDVARDNRQLHAAGETDQSGPDGSSLATLVVATTGSNSLDLGPARSRRAAGGRRRARALP
jgi:SAM-dependent methyltransferase